jgi:hypothetical protein
MEPFYFGRQGRIIGSGTQIVALWKNRYVAGKLNNFSTSHKITINSGHK